MTKLKGLSLKTRIELYASVNDKNCLLSSSGDTLITHWGLSGPCVLKLSAWGAAQLHELNYQCCIKVNWLPHLHTDNLNSLLRKEKQRAARKQVNKQAQFHLPKRFWSFLMDSAGIDQTKLWADLSKSELNAITRSLTATYLEINGKSTYKEEFVTAGGVDLKEIDLRNYRSKKLPQLKIIGEALNIDAITGGFNFQSAWTSAYIAATIEGS
jgi:predicted Rossmann fold flavoprotein